MSQRVPQLLHQGTCNVVKHEHFEELCAAASMGQATPEELFELEQHVETCDACHKTYWDYLNLDAQQVAEHESNPHLSSREAKDSLNSGLFTRRFFERAEKEGIVFSGDVGAEARKLTPQPLARTAWWPKASLAVAATVIIAGMVSGAYFYGKRAWLAGLHSVPTGSSNYTPSDTQASGLGQRVGELTATNARLQVEIEGLKAALTNANEQLRLTKSDLSGSEEDRERLDATRTALETRLKTAEEALAESQTLAASAQQDAAKQREHAGDIEATLVADNIKIDDLREELAEKSAALDQERQLLALGHDVSDLMGARNLHIVDVVDTDPKGKTRPAFGRIFFTEGKSLVFYAYDLNEAKIQKASYQYRVWAKQEGGEKQVRSMGIFYSDDKAQRRWVFKCNDPKILREIDSVFVTLEPAGTDPHSPKGENLMYAYLRGQPTHP